jgi:hypothetical protein
MIAAATVQLIALGFGRIKLLPIVMYSAYAA